jgi:4-amino-4-deoxy-L-arabinose transferase-like glycosyltransferase
MPHNLPLQPEAPGPFATQPSPHRPAVYLALLAFAAIVIFAGMHALPLTDPDEVFYAGTAKEMLEHGRVLTPILFGEPNFEKPPLTYWLLMASFKVFGVHAAAARLVPAVFGLLGALATFFFIERIVSKGTAALAALILATAMLYLGQSIALLTDMVFSVLVAGGLYSFYAWFSEKREVFLYLFAALLGLAVMTKGPVGFVIALLTIVLFLRVTGENDVLRTFLFHPWWLVFAVIAVPWYAYATLIYGHAFTWEFFIHDNWHRILRAEHKNLDSFWFYPALMVVGIFPWTAFLAYLGASFRKYSTYVLFLGSWFLATWGIFTIAHSKLPSYILPLFPALAIALAISLESPVAMRTRTTVAAAISFLCGVSLLASPFLVKAQLALQLRPILIALAGLGAAQLAVGALLLCRRLASAVALNAGAFLAAVLVGCLTVPASATTGFTDAGVAKVVAEQGLAGQPILTSKFYVRGASFYTGSPVVVMDPHANPFWSPHPVPLLQRDDQVRAFFDAKEKVLCVIRPRDLERLDRLFAGARTNDVLSRAFDRLVVLSVKETR